MNIFIIKLILLEVLVRKNEITYDQVSYLHAFLLGYL